MARSTSASTTVQTRDVGLAGGRRAIEIRQRVTLTGAASHVALGANIPARSRVVWYKLLNVTDIQTCGNATNAADAVALIMFPTTSTQPVTAPPTTGSFSNAVSNFGSNGMIIGRTLTTASNNTGRGMPILGTIGNCHNTATVGAYLALLPIQANSNVYSPAANTAGMVFGTNSSQTATAGTVEVELHVEQFADGAEW
jgi:hypothetical protein